ncbi:uncharacterized protein [Aristolochia californica]|uniref:uncharacterized protein isoform X1 n=1 Tax=Aristolochia californica TaxID=171875 RepID=UPI0035DC627D
MDIISSNPRSFKLDRKSSQASKLKQTVVEKLIEFPGNDSGNVLAEYIVVLVCNGKNQNEARDDLEAFLGYQSGKFVSWLWDHLLKSVIHSGSSNLKNASLNNFYGDRKDKDKRSIRSMIHLNHSTGVSDSHMSKDDKRHNQAVLSTKQILSDTLGLEEEFQRWCPDSCVPVADANAKEGRPKHRSLVSQNSTYDGNSRAIGKTSFNSQVSYRTSGSIEQILLYGDRNKMVISDNCLLSDSLHYSPKRKLVPRSLQPGTEKPLSMFLPVTSGTRLRLSSRAPHDVPDQFVRPRGSVWDRLGKPIEKNTVMTDDKICLEERNTMKKKKQHHGGASNHGFKKIIVPDDWLQSRFLTESPLLNDSSGRATNDPGIYNITKKRHFRGSRIHNSLVVASESHVANAKDEQTVLGIQISPYQCLSSVRPPPSSPKKSYYTKGTF